MKRQLRVEAPFGEPIPDSGQLSLDSILGSPWIPLALVIVAVVLLFLPIHAFEYNLVDDADNVYANRFIANIHAQNVGYLWMHTYYDLYMPVTDTIWALLARIAPLKTPLVVIRDIGPTVVNPAVFHAASLAFHLATTVLVFGILRQLRLKPWACAVGALLFGAHPLQVESVAWITGMNNLTSGFFGFLAVFLYLLQPVTITGSSVLRPTKHRTLLLLLATGAFTLALLSKPLATIIPLFIAVLELVALQRPMRLWWRPVAFWLILSFGCVVVTHIASSEADYSNLSPLWARPFVAADALTFYLIKLFFPYELTFDYGRNPPFVLRHWWGYASGVLLIVIVASTVISLRFISLKRDRDISSGAGRQGRLSRFFSDNEFVLRIVTAGFLVFCSGLLPTLGLIPYYSEANSTVSDRYVYLAMLGPAMAAAAVSSYDYGTKRSQRLVQVVMAVAIASCVCLTSLELPIWANRYSFTNDMLSATPNSPLAHQFYGVVLGGQGKWGDALVEFRKAEHLSLNPSASVDDSIGQSLFHLKQYDEAIAHYKAAIRSQPDDNNAWFQLWLIYSRRNRLKEAEEYVRERLAKYPDDDRAKFTLGLVLMQENRPADALPYVEVAAKNDPDSSDDQFYVGVVNQKLGRYSEAETHYKRAVELNPDNTDAVQGLESLPQQLRNP